MTTVYVLTENEPHEGGAVHGVYSTLERARAAAATYRDDWYMFRLIEAVELDAAPGYDMRVVE